MSYFFMNPTKQGIPMKDNASEQIRHTADIEEILNSKNDFIGKWSLLIMLVVVVIAVSTLYFVMQLL